jgi:hypothetical protein
MHYAQVVVAYVGTNYSGKLVIKTVNWIVENKEWLFSGILASVFLALIAFFYRRIIKFFTAKNKPLAIDGFEVLDQIEATEFIVRLNKKQSIKLPFVTVTVKTLNSWDFSTGLLSPGALYPSARPPGPAVLISPQKDAIVKLNLLFDKNNEIKLKLYTDHIIKDSIHQFVGNTVFLLYVTISAGGFDDWNTTTIVRLEGGYALTIGSTKGVGVTHEEHNEQIYAAKTLVAAHKKGAHINKDILADLIEVSQKKEL